MACSESQEAFLLEELQLRSQITRDWDLCNHYKLVGLCLRILLVSDSVSLSQDCCSWSVFPCFFEICVCCPVGLTRKKRAHGMYCHCFAIFLVYGCNIFHWQIVCAVLLSKEKPCVSHINTPFLSWASRNSVLGAVPRERCLLSIQAIILIFVLLLLHGPHTRICIHAACASSLFFLLQISANPSLVSVDWFQMGTAGKGKRPHRYLQRISLRGALVRFRTRKTV